MALAEPSLPDPNLKTARYGLRPDRPVPAGISRAVDAHIALRDDGSAHCTAIRDARRGDWQCDGLGGTYDVRLQYSVNLATDAPFTSIFEAIQEQLGLRLTAGKAELLVIERIDKTPTGTR